MHCYLIPGDQAASAWPSALYELNELYELIWAYTLQHGCASICKGLSSGMLCPHHLHSNS